MIKLKDIVEKLLKDCDPDIAEIMMAETDARVFNRPALGYELVENPLLFIATWQLMRDNKRVEVTGTEIDDSNFSVKTP